MPGVLVLAATPLGNVADAPPRLAAELAAADVVAAEDTRRLHRLRVALGVQLRGRVVSHFEGNERARVAELLDALAGGARVLVVTDAGMPTVSDPGYRLVAAAAAAGHAVTCVPGPSAVLAALAVSGLPTDRFAFEGFLPRRPGERRRRAAELAGEPRTLVLFEAPHRLGAALTELAGQLGAERRAVVCRELTKAHEEVVRGSLAELAERFAGEVRGEVTVVVEGRPARSRDHDADPAREVQARVAAGLDRRAAVAEVAAELRLPKREVYAAVVAARDAGGGDAPRR